MFVALSCFTIANDTEQEVKAAFRDRPHLVDRADGFLSMEVMSPVGAPAEIWLLTRWRDEQSYRGWHRSDDYHKAHKSIPKGIKLAAGSAGIRLFDVFAN